MNQPNPTLPQHAAATPPASAPMPPAGRPALEPAYESPPEPAPNRGTMIAIGAVGAAVLLFGIGMIWRGSGASTPAPAQAAAPASNFFTEQQQFMREAMDMAREAQKMQRERMEMMRREMELAEEGPIDGRFPSDP